MEKLILENVSYSYVKGKDVLKDMNYKFESGKIYAITGKSGTGKTTLLSVLSMLSKPTSGDVLFEGKSIKQMNPYHYRSKQVGIIFQAFNLLPLYSALENVVLSMDVSKYKGANKNTHAKQLLAKVGLEEDEMYRRILKLSGGQQQRVAIARAISFNPSVILADEPTGNLDSQTEAEILEIFKDLAYKEDKCIIIVTHSNKVASFADVVYAL